MKKIQLNAAKLQLNKEKITHLTANLMQRAVGGGDTDMCNPQKPIVGSAYVNCSHAALVCNIYTGDANNTGACVRG